MQPGAWLAVVCNLAGLAALEAAEIPKPFVPPCVEREAAYEFTEKPVVKMAGEDRYEISFAVKSNCDVTVGIVDEQGVVVRHLASGVLGSNAPAPFQKNSLRQTVVWNGKDDLDWYPKSPERLKVRVMLGLKPVFDKRLGGTSPHNLPCGPWGTILNAEGAYVFAFNGGGFNHGTVRKFGHDGEYLGTVYPPPARQPLEQSEGMGFVEFEDGKKTRHGNDLHDSVAGNGGLLGGLTGTNSANSQVALAGDRLVYLSMVPTTIAYALRTNGTTDQKGMAGTLITAAGGLARANPLLVSSPDAQWVYMTRVKGLDAHVVYRWPADGSKGATPFLGEVGKPGSDHAHFNGPSGLDCDAQGRIYVADGANNRLQIYSPEGKHLKSLPVERPGLVRVHKKSGAIYAQHGARIQGKSVDRLTKFSSFDNPSEEFHVDGLGSSQMALDSWSAKPRLWLAGEVKTVKAYSAEPESWHGLRIHEEDGAKFRLLSDFDELARKDAGPNYIGRWGGDCFDKVWCDPVREQAYYRTSCIFDLKTGQLAGRYAAPCSFDDASFDKHGYMHLHFNPCFFGKGVGRVDPARKSAGEAGKGAFHYPECPYDYGEEAHGWKGVLPTRDQCGAKGFQDGLGVNMRGDVASECNIYHVPKFEDEVREQALAGDTARIKSGVWSEEANSYNAFLKGIVDAQKRGEEVYYVKHQPGVPLHGGTVWTFDRSGELLLESAVLAGDLINGVQMDQDRSIYFVNSRPKVYNEKPFLYGKGGILGTASRSHPFTGTLIKSGPNAKCRILLANAAVKMDLPKRPPDLMSLDFMEEAYMGKGGWCWLEGAEWLYAGAGPLTSVGCSCPRQHLGLDWYRRTYVPEVYRHSIGILDTNGNLLMHLGRYGNFDDAPGGRDGAKPGSEDVGLLSVRFISVTDNYLVFGDWCERLLVLKLEYQAEESVPLRTK